MSRPMTIDELNAMVRAARDAAARERARWLVLVNPEDFERIPADERARVNIGTSPLVPPGTLYLLGGRTLTPSDQARVPIPPRRHGLTPVPGWRKRLAVAATVVFLLLVGVLWVTR